LPERKGRLARDAFFVFGLHSTSEKIFPFSGEGRSPLLRERDIEKWFPAFAGKEREEDW
jgi:hypothetical protein